MATRRGDGRWVKIRDGQAYYSRLSAEDADAKATAGVRYVPSTPDSLHEFACTVWLPTLEQKTPATRKRYSDAYRLHIRDSLGQMDLDSLDFQRIQEWVNQTKGSPATRRLAFCVLNTILSLADRLERIRRNPAKGVSLPKKPRKRERVLRLEQAIDVLQKVPHDLKAPVFLSAFLGLRLGEVAGLRWECLNRQTGSLYIFEQARQIKLKGKGGGIEMCPVKTDGSTRTLVLPPGLVEMIDRYGDLDSEWVCTHLRKQWMPETLSEWWRDWVRAKEQKALGLVDWHFHDLRHLAAGLLYSVTRDAAAVSACLGHTSLDMTWSYLSVLEEQRKEPFEKLFERLGIGESQST